MEIGPVEFIKEGAKSVLGKKGTSKKESNTARDVQHAMVEQVKSSSDSNS